MGWLRKKADPVSERARALNEEIADLEARIKQLDAQLQEDQSQPRLRSTAVPRGETLNHSAPAPVAHEPVFEAVDQNLLETRAEAASNPEHFNDLGVRKYDLPAFLRRLRHQFRGPTTTNPKLVSYLAAGGIQGLRPMRYERRVARNRFIALVAFFFFLLLGIVALFVHHH